jgi:two-component system, LuxR family, response regulator FixJ
VFEEPTVFVVDDDPAIRDSLALLMKTNNLRTRLCANADQFLACYDPSILGCVLMDVKLPGMNGMEVLSHLSGAGIPATVIFLTGHADIPMAVAAIKGGAFTLIQKPFWGSDLLCTVHEAIDKNRGVRQRWIERVSVEKRLATLTPRETTVLDLIVAGHATKSVAAQLGTSFNTVRNQRMSIMRKMQTDSVVQLVRIMTQHWQDSPRDPVPPPSAITRSRMAGMTEPQISQI